MCKLRTFSLAAAALVLASCASNEKAAELNLENVLDLKARREAVLARAEAEEKNEEAPAPDVTTAGILETSSYKTPEIAFFEAPESFRPLPGGELERLRAEDPATVPPFAEAGWMDAGSGVMVLAGGAQMDRNAVLAMTREDFMKKLNTVGSVYDRFFGEEYQSQSRLQVRDQGALVAVDVLSKYVLEDEWRAQKRIFYLFRPDYRLGFVVAGKDEDVMKALPELEAAMALLEARLLETYPEGIRFREEKENLAQQDV